MLIALADEIRDDLFEDEDDEYSSDEEFNEAASPEERSIKQLRRDEMRKVV